MANQQHLKLLKLGVKRWNRWMNADRKPGEWTFRYPDLSEADLSRTYLRHADFMLGNLSGTNLRDAKLYGASFAWADLTCAFLSNASLGWADFTGAHLVGADLRNAYLDEARFIDADLRDADLSNANISKVYFLNTRLKGANLSRALLAETVFINCDLTEVRELELAQHLGPSDVALSTIYSSKGMIPEVFLRGCGLPESFIVQIPALVAAVQPIQFYSCFISYSSKDQKFAERLHADLQNKGVRCWYAPHDLKIGEKIRVGIDESIRLHDKLLLILSKNSIESEWVEKEVETAMERERRQKRTILFPVRLDDAVLKVENGWAADVRRSRNVGDFRRWKSHDTYSKAFERLIRDLQASA